MNNTLIVLLGPTGVGKTDLAIDLALHLGCEIISADSRQVYSGMKIGTAVPDDAQLSMVRHHFIGTLPIDQYYSSSLYERDVLALLPSLFERHHAAILTGGSGMYIDAVCNGTDEIPDVDPAAREKYLDLYRREGINGLRIALKLLDPDHYARVDLKNHKRILRALEICETTGRPYSGFLTKQKQSRDFRIVRIGLRRERVELYRRINERVDLMIEAGLEEEARQLYPFREHNALISVGYREFFDYFDGALTREKAIELIKRNSRRYAKRQMTWWAKDTSITWFDPSRKDEILRFARNSLDS